MDHPRSRGVHPPGGACLPAPMGSSPLARGPQNGLRIFRSSKRIIPARAGSTKVLLKPFFHFQDHPRSRGVHHSCSLPPETGWGSSSLARSTGYLRICGSGWQDHPLARGPAFARSVGAELGIIPARAGSTRGPT